MPFKDYKLTGYLIEDEIVNFTLTEDEASGLSGMMSNLLYQPGPHTLEFWSGTGKSGTQYSVQHAGAIPDTSKVLLVDAVRGLLLAGDTVPNSVYASYYGFGSPLLAIEMNQAFYCREENAVFWGTPPDGSTIDFGIAKPYTTLIQDIQILANNPPTTGNATYRVQNDEAGSSYIDITIVTGQTLSSPISGTLTIPATGRRITKCITGNMSGNLQIKYLYGVSRIK